MASSPEEWLRQADYDMDTAKFMLRGGRTAYAVFFCHLSVEKGLKGLYHEAQVMSRYPNELAAYSNPLRQSQ
jgi:HEPN domain-containing protein